MAAAGGPIRYRPIPLDSIAPPLVAAVLTAEDARFRQHRGIDWYEVRRAARLSAHRLLVELGAGPGGAGAGAEPSVGAP